MICKSAYIFAMLFSTLCLSGCSNPQQDISSIQTDEPETVIRVIHAVDDKASKGVEVYWRSQLGGSDLLDIYTFKPQPDEGDYFGITGTGAKGLKQVKFDIISKQSGQRLGGFDIDDREAYIWQEYKEPFVLRVSRPSGTQAQDILMGIRILKKPPAFDPKRMMPELPVPKNETDPIPKVFEIPDKD